MCFHQNWLGNLFTDIFNKKENFQNTLLPDAQQEKLTLYIFRIKERNKYLVTKVSQKLSSEATVWESVSSRSLN